MKKIVLLYIVLIFSNYGYSQNNAIKPTFWKFMSLKGEFNLKGSFWNQETKKKSIDEQLKSSFMSGSLLLNTRSFFYHPNFIEVELDAGFSPQTGQVLSLISPDQSETNNLKKLYASIVFFQHNNLNLNVFTNLNKGYSNRENLTNIKTNFKNWGSVLTYNNKYLPFNITYNQLNNDQLELQTNRFYKTNSNTIYVKASKSFGLRDQNQFIFSHNKYTFNDQFSLSTQFQTGEIVKNDITSWTLTDNIYFDKKKNYNINSMVSNNSQEGKFTYQRFQVLENLLFRFPWNINFSSYYGYFKIQQGSLNSKQQNIRSILNHQLYKSLTTSAMLEYNTNKSTVFTLDEKRTNINIRYVKKVPFKGLLNLSYSINNHQEKRHTESSLLTILNEEYLLSDSKMVLLNNQNVNEESVLVKDKTGTILYKLNLDYVLIKRNELLEIQRVPGGEISNNTSVFIDYLALQANSYKFNSLQNIFSASLSLFKKKIMFYYKNSKRDYLNTVNIENLTLDFYNQHVYGGSVDFGIINGGVEQDNFKSVIIPYRLTRYYFEIQGRLRNKLMFSLNGDLRDYQMIIEEGKKQQSYNVSGNMSYNINKNMKIKLLSSYRKENTGGIELNLLTSRLELSAVFRQMFITTGFEYNKSELVNEIYNFKKVTIRISRKF